MSLLARIISKRLSTHFTGLERNKWFYFRTMALQPATYRPPPSIGHDEDNMKRGRPLSPHITIYRAGIPMGLSLIHRVTGIGLGVFGTFLGWCSFLPFEFENLCQGIEDYMPYPLIVLGKAFLAFFVCYHTLNGARHMLWDSGNFLSLKEVHLTGYVMLAVFAVVYISVVTAGM